MKPHQGISSSGRVAIALFTGLAAGVIIGMLFAPKSGKEIRNNLVETGERLMEMGKESVSDVVEKTKQTVESGKEKIEELKTAVR